jgi:hypothetical protein
VGQQLEDTGAVQHVNRCRHLTLKLLDDHVLLRRLDDPRIVELHDRPLSLYFIHPRGRMADGRERWRDEFETNEGKVAKLEGLG